MAKKAEGDLMREKEKERETERVCLCVFVCHRCPFRNRLEVLLH